MVRALLDANVLISAAIRPGGPPGQIVTALLAQTFELVLSPGIIEEVETALALPKIRKYLREADEALRWLADIVAIADLVLDTGNVTGVCRDPGDDVVLAAAVEGRASVIVTGDDDLLTLREYNGIIIVAPRLFLDRISG
ncbi:MAG: putative toxin-antitoxin system toxin component, PIN family [Woeseia sp.]